MDDQETESPQEAVRPNPAWRRRYYTILAGQAVSQVGSSAVQFALVWFLAQETASPAAMGLAGLAAFLPGAILSPAAGIVADRHNRKRVCIAADLAAGIMATAFALAMGSWGVSVAAVIALLAARAAATAAAPILARSSGVRALEGDSSISFWFRRCMEQSRSPR